MMSLFESMPWTVYLILSFGGAITSISYFTINRLKYPKEITIGIFCLSYTSFVAGLDKIINILAINLNISWISFPGYIGLPLIFIGAYKHTKNDPNKRKVVVMSAFLSLISALVIGAVVLIKITQK